MKELAVFKTGDSEILPFNCIFFLFISPKQQQNGKKFSNYTSPSPVENIIMY